MSWKALLKTEAEHHYPLTDNLMKLVEDGELDWKPSHANNWMTLGQTLMHLATACGAPIKGVVTGDWGVPEDVDLSNLSPEEMLPPAEKMPTVQSVDEARRLLEEDRLITMDMLDMCSDNDLANKPAPVPWDPSPIPMGHRCLQMIDHLKAHKIQLFYYLKIQGKPVNTGHLWGG